MITGAYFTFTIVPVSHLSTSSKIRKIHGNNLISARNFLNRIFDASALPTQRGHRKNKIKYIIKESSFVRGTTLLTRTHSSPLYAIAFLSFLHPEHVTSKINGKPRGCTTIYTASPKILTPRALGDVIGVCYF